MQKHAHKTLTTEAEIAAYMNRPRMAILNALRDGASTSSQIAAKLGVHPANLTRHMRILEEAGLIALVEKRDTGRNLEKYYAAAAWSFDVAPDASGLTAPHKLALAFARSEFSAALARLPDGLDVFAKIFVLSARLAPAQLDAFSDELSRLAERFAAANGEAGEAFHLVMALYPGDGVSGEDRPQIRLIKDKESRK
jgi:DNA-binding transcriptional ArsR family regulator